MIAPTNILFGCLFTVAFFIYLHEVWHIITRPNSHMEKARTFTENNQRFHGSSRKPIGWAVKHCILSNNDANLWKYFTNITDDCVKFHAAFLPDSFLDFPVGRFKESKSFLPIIEKVQNCYWLTIGIGGDTLVEKMVKLNYHECRIFGVEPSPDQYSDFSNYGTVLPFAVGIKSGKKLMRIRQKSGGYSNVNVQVAPLVEVLDKYIQSRLIHFVTIDIEGFEYAILDGLIKGNALETADVRFCQVDVELHSQGNQLQAMGANFKFYEFWRNFLSFSHYVPVKSAVTLFSHRKVTLINTRDRECRRVFGFDRYF